MGRNRREKKFPLSESLHYYSYNLLIDLRPASDNRQDTSSRSDVCGEGNGIGPLSQSLLKLTENLILIIGGSCHKYHFCRDKTFVVTNTCLWQTFLVTKTSRQTFCLDKLTFVATNTCLLRQNISFVSTKACLLRQNFCRDKQVFVATTIFCHGKHTFVISRDKDVATNVLSRQAYFCRDKQMFVATTIFCHDKHTVVATKDSFFVATNNVFVATKLLSRQKWYLWQLLPMVILRRGI